MRVRSSACGQANVNEAVLSRAGGMPRRESFMSSVWCSRWPCVVPDRSLSRPHSAQPQTTRSRAHRRRDDPARPFPARTTAPCSDPTRAKNPAVPTIPFGQTPRLTVSLSSRTVYTAPKFREIAPVQQRHGRWAFHGAGRIAEGYSSGLSWSASPTSEADASDRSERAMCLQRVVRRGLFISMLTLRSTQLRSIRRR